MLTGMKNIFALAVFLFATVVILHANGTTTGHVGVDATVSGLLTGAASLLELGKNLIS